MSTNSSIRADWSVPGPWHVVDEDGGDKLQVRGKDDEFVADCNDGFYDDNDDGRWQQAPSSLPTALLVAAAPDLLKACRLAIAALKGREHDGFLRDAIAKATGEIGGTL